jgi:putative nucleotidyltransferase with HDIG domain
MGSLIQNYNNRLVAVVNSDSKRRDTMCMALKSFYSVLALSDGHTAIQTLRRNVPAVIIVDEFVRPGDSIGFISAVRAEEELQKVPIIHVITHEGDRLFSQGKMVGATVSLQYPFHRSFLINTISKILNANVEREWNALPPIPQAALKNTAHTFKDIANVMMSGESLPFIKIKQSCEPMLAAIQDTGFQAILEGVRNHDDYTYAHSLRVATFLTLLGHAAGFSENEQLLLASGGLLHDVGKMMIPYEVLNKPGKLTPDEFDTMKSHVNHTVDYLALETGIPKAVFIIAEQHHEKIDGSGYPYGLKGAELNELARMASVVDVFTALTDRRVYKDSVSSEKALDMMANMTGHLDQNYVAMFKDMIGDAGLLAAASAHGTQLAHDSRYASHPL